ncbi:UNVERIFIED_CONTAM: hypothetical protein FKN15_021863, partial [Acipenser sinensis]
QAKMERDLSNKRMFQDEEAPETGAGSEFGKKLREVSRRKKFGFVPREFKLEDQPWLLRVNGKAGRKFKGQKKGGVTDNACYYIFTQCPDGAFEAFPVHTWYNFSTVARHRTLTAEEAEEEWDRSEDDEPEKMKPNKGQNVPKGIDEASDSSEESEEEKKEEKKEDEEEEEDEEEGKKTPVQQEKKKKKGTGAGRRGAPLGVPSERGSARSPRKKTPPKRPGGKGSAGSSRAGSRPGTPSLDSGSTSSTLHAAASKLEQGGRDPHWRGREVGIHTGEAGSQLNCAVPSIPAHLLPPVSRLSSSLAFYGVGASLESRGK